ncbi:hypothetical protein PFAG_05384 [Plasmodium falciparum Santa Lucia]|uniref:PhIL1 interacting protein PIP2 n=13 Tax=Plasmodium falciparum TaxID=5833 RepID=Q8ILF4_PLAF7|nr:PhIL1 interacting protein PIP2 [Plasmodium falciparum 3D7]ETW16099.1 hypothetical protein PFFVO_04931 [Plasmodium falciparum Vietnam Oak-Knoll (FVO)]ETW33330.1 hypothetical protein PFTANZ_05951 [Plasmodium falciparum Tanzania (2000708)]ETW39971.1 hypothetical protein PFNF135_05997 [Plasmodium falciparum NF135/5.C10]ETW45721.1 hypothetical protein PFMALIP_06218 [Plasmodium falciparum MaliPS096_E11]ETW53952.1 hypothetical protein PFUGPA_03825 [Plasmodium falciparum Palo Alto/Uganda]ETW58258.|eukprot:XP_001348464.1 conserved Plasmodium protein, unknown function [Plasmodium falciparum 3D7]
MDKDKDKSKNTPLLYQDTMNDLGDGLQNMDTLRLNRNGNTGNGNKNKTNGSKGVKGEYEKKKETNGHDDYVKESLNRMLESHIDQYFKGLDYYKNNPKCKIDPKIHLHGSEEIENYIVKEKIFVTTYFQYIDVYENAINVDEDLEKEEIVYVEVPKYVTKYKPKIVTNIIEKTIEIPSGEEIKQPKYNTVNVPYVIPNIVENEILVVLKKIIQPEIEITNEELEIEVEKYIPRLVPVNVYVPRYFGISAKAKGEPEESVRYVDLTQDQIDELMKELNPHLNELKVFNETQLKRMDEYMRESQMQARAHNFEPPQPQLITYDESGHCQSYDYSEFHRFKETCIKELTH